MVAGDDVLKSCGLESTHDGAAHKTSVPSDKNTVVNVQGGAPALKEDRDDSYSCTKCSRFTMASSCDAGHMGIR